jgi:hypothetical protein
MVWLGAALMAWNVYRYIRFSRDASVTDSLKQETRILNFPILLLVLFLCGYKEYSEVCEMAYCNTY